jgi:hypothetical protein
MSNGNTIVHAWGPGPTISQLTGQIFDVLLALPVFAVTPLLRSWHRRWGATDAEVNATMPGDHLVPGCQYVITRAISIDAPPSEVWPWLVQIGFGKAGFYSNDFLDNFGHPSADRIIGRFQELRIGDWIPMFSKVNDTTAFKVHAIEPLKSLVWLKPDSTWAWVLASTGSGTRMITRIRILYRWKRPAEAVFSLFLNEFGDFAMMRTMLNNIKQRAENNRQLVAT